MLQQTQVARVVPVWTSWMARWPTPAALAADSAGDAVRAWGRLGYPRRALRLHEAARQVTARHGGQVPATHDDLLALSGVGAYTAAAVASFAFGARHAVVDTNVRRVQARAVTGVALPAPALSAAEARLARSLLPDAAVAPRWAVAVMELGALVCTARAPRCGACPLLGRCAWQRAGAPVHDGPPRRGQPFEGTDRQVRGRVLALLRAGDAAVDERELAAAVPDADLRDPDQRRRCVAALVRDGLLELEDGRYHLPR